MSSQIAAQMYTLREFTKTPADIAKTLSRVKQLGYDAVQLSALGPIDAKELAKILKDNALTCCATHVSLERMTSDTQGVIDDHKLWGCNFTAIGGFFPKENVTAETWTTFIDQYNALAKKFAGSGVSLGYHNHSHELARYESAGGATSPFQLMIERFDPSIWFEVDTYWITHGGGDPIQWINKVAGRIPSVHLKDMAITNDRTQFMAEVGVGNLNFPGIIEACKKAGTKWFIVEQDVCYRDPFDSLKTSLENLKAMGMT